MQQQPKNNNPMFNQRLNELMNQIKAIRDQIAMMDKLVGTPAPQAGPQASLGGLPSGPLGGPGSLGNMPMGMGPAGGPPRLPMGMSGPGPNPLGGPQPGGMQSSKFQQWAAPGMQGLQGDMGGLDSMGDMPGSGPLGSMSGGLASIDVGVPEFIPGQPWAGAQSLNKQDPTQDPFMTPAQFRSMQGQRISLLGGLGSVTTAALGNNPGPGTSSTS